MKRFFTGFVGSIGGFYAPSYGPGSRAKKIIIVTAILAQVAGIALRDGSLMYVVLLEGFIFMVVCFWPKKELNWGACTSNCPTAQTQKSQFRPVTFAGQIFDRAGK